MKHAPSYPIPSWPALNIWYICYPSSLRLSTPVLLCRALPAILWTDHVPTLPAFGSRSYDKGRVQWAGQTMITFFGQKYTNCTHLSVTLYFFGSQGIISPKIDETKYRVPLEYRRSERIDAINSHVAHKQQPSCYTEGPVNAKNIESCRLRSYVWIFLRPRLAPSLPITGQYPMLISPSLPLSSSCRWLPE
jgi:hypothetical protein